MNKIRIFTFLVAGAIGFFALTEALKISHVEAKTKVNYYSGGWDIEFGPNRHNAEGNQGSGAASGASGAATAGNSSSSSGSAGSSGSSGAPGGGPAGFGGNAGNAGGIGTTASGGMIAQFIGGLLGWEARD